MANIEILAPVGSEEMLKAAVFSGADAVYLGYAGLNARSGAGSFTALSLPEAVAFCHGRGVKVYVAMNITVYAEELFDLADAIETAAKCGVDALICQDLAVARLAKDIAPELELHASTQMSVHTLAGAKQLAKMGFTRVVLARELSYEEIKHITQNAGIETEVFVHGALCMSMSGQCYMSAFLGGRSGNRGSCAGPCRLPFDAADLPEGMFGRERNLSLKDNSIIDKLNKLQAAGVSSAKIEGRLKTPEYVAAAVNACLAGRIGEEYDKVLLEKAFSRSGFTDGYFNGKLDASMFGMRSDADAAVTKKALPTLRELYRRERSAVHITCNFELEEFGAKLTVFDNDGNKAIVYSETEPEPAKNDLTEGLKKSLAKTGGTPFLTSEINVNMHEGLWYIPAGAVNEMRRVALEQLLKKRETLRPITINEHAQIPVYPQRQNKMQKELWASFSNWEQVPLEQVQKLKYIIIPIAQAQKVPEKLRVKTILSLPRAMFGEAENQVKLQIEKTSKLGFAGYEVQNIAHILLAEGLPMFGGFGLNITNPAAAQSYAELGFSSVLVLPEVREKGFERISPNNNGKAVPTGAISYGHMPLMLTRACPLHNVTSCEKCKHKGFLTDRKARKFPLDCQNGAHSIYNPVPIYMGDKQNSLNVDYTLALFTSESNKQASEWITRLLKAEVYEGEYTRGLYFKGTV